MELARSKPKQKRTRRKVRRISKEQRELVMMPPKALKQKLRRKTKFHKLKVPKLMNQLKKHQSLKKMSISKLLEML